MLRTQALKNRTLNLTVPKNRKPKFDLTLKIVDLNNIPLVVGTAFVKWHLPSSTAAEHRGRTEKAPITDHKCVWNYTKELVIRMTIDKTLLLSEADIHFEVLQEYSEGARHGRVVLGQVTLNLAEYAGHMHLDTDTNNDPEDEGITRRYLMQQSKINSTLKISIHLKQLDGDTNFTTPPLKSAMVFGGIAGIVSTEAATEDPDGTGSHIPTIASKTRELSELQDIYRRTLAATWACQTGELPPDKLIEDLFSGGDGGRMQPPQPTPTSRWRRGAVNHHDQHQQQNSHDGGSSSDTESRRTLTPTHRRPDSALSKDSDEVFGPPHGRGPRHLSVDDTSTGLAAHHHHHHTHVGSISGRGSIDQQLLLQPARGGVESGGNGASNGGSGNGGGGGSSGRRRTNSNYREYSEFALREDLKSWSVGSAEGGSHGQETITSALVAGGS